MTTKTGIIPPKTMFQTWAFTGGPDHHNTSMTHAVQSGANGEIDGKTLCGRSMYGYLESDLDRYGIRCRACAKIVKRILEAK